MLKCIGSKIKCLTFPQLNIMEFAAAVAEAEPLIEGFVNELESDLEVARLGYVHDIPSVESIEAVSAAAIGPAAVGSFEHNISSSGRSRISSSSNMARRAVRRRPIPIVTIPRSGVTMARSRARRRRPRMRRRFTRRRHGAAGFRAWNSRAAIGSSSSTHNRVMHLKRLMRPQENTGSKKNIKVFQYSGFVADTFGFYYVFRFDEIPGYTNWTSTWEWYKITNVKLTFIPLQNAHLGSNVSNATNPIKEITTSGGSETTKLVGLAPRIIVAPDNSSTSLFTSENEALAHDNSKLHVFNGSEEFMVSMRPLPITLVGADGSFARSDRSPRGYISTSANGIAQEHYGVRGYIQGLHTGIQIAVYQEISVALKGLKL